MKFGRNFLVLLVVLLSAFVLSAGCTGTDSSAPAITATPTMTPEITGMSIPDVVGIWTGTATGHSPSRGFGDRSDQWWNITEQDGQVFTGYKEHTNQDGEVVRESFSGAISYDGKSVYIIDHGEGNVIGDFIGPDELELRLLNDGPEGKLLIFHLTRE